MTTSRSASSALILATLFASAFGGLTMGIQWLGLGLEGLLAGALVASIAAAGSGRMLRPAFRSLNLFPAH